jgi:DNA invertase Pin-like site-specific DNA recombinase
MAKQVVLYARVSDPKSQDTDDKVSIQQQLADMRALCKREGWQIIGTLVDNESYRATRIPQKGKIVKPSGERADRPQLLAMLESVKAGDVDAIVCWRDDRLVRHPRVAVALEDALDAGDAQRNGKDKIQIYDATGAVIDRFTLSIKATIWREENKRRAERNKMGKIATLQQGRWPSSFNRLGYRTVKETGMRGRAIEIEEAEAHWVQQIFSWADAGISMGEIQRRLIEAQAPQKGLNPRERKHDWTPALIHKILRAEAYTGRLTYRFADGTKHTIEIPQIVRPEVWERVQERIDRNKALSTRNARGIYLLQGLIHCGDCGCAMTVHASRYTQYTRPDGTKKNYPYINPQYAYMCVSPTRYPNELHPRPSSRSGVGLDWAVWRQLVDFGLKRPDLIREFIDERRAALQAEVTNAESDIERIRKQLERIEQERLAYCRQNARGVVTEAEFGQLMNETEKLRRNLTQELGRLETLRDGNTQVEEWQEYMADLFAQVREELDTIDCDRKTLYGLPRNEHIRILKRRREIIRALVDRVVVHASGRVEIIGALDGSEAAQFELRYSEAG